MKCEKTVMNALKITVIVGAIFLMQTTASAQTALEKQCRDALQGKVTMDGRSNQWPEEIARSLCQGTTNPSATVSCYQNEMRSHGDWGRAFAACQKTIFDAVKLPGTARDIDAKNGVVYVIGSNAVPGGYGLWKLVKAGWVQVPPGGGVRVAVTPAGIPWVVDSAGVVKQLVGANWRPVATEKKAIDLAFDKSGKLWVILEDGRVMNSWDMKTFKEQFEDAKNAVRLTALTQDLMLITTATKKDYVVIFQGDGPTITCAGVGGMLRPLRYCLSIAEGYIENVFDTADGTQWAIDSSLAIWKIKAK